ncbi:UDP-N-acetylmuramoyl-L-alanyl-D-glutamate--2,6-diaminopimelate ligase [Synechococcus sp. CS-1325]|uniref:UDP-N-acetylmuramoyl-L-alanyl-D-glutamate--2, 6-diaminopimelate ligase n=1 Tax=unclassified Synechococcus TaxID=2626047 RepID=UPI000DB5C6CA|nr:MULTISPECIES: UDP-N-acetylmuramoyl-L-alanyl-D-glutamate--2,6-diaminopimelate ligase [unclassified Synechococcus]MCT0198754.1 UDP-N-acetylmuramoyl-L-alanyl-D-glutamate--2,6-diaminopimelate ligase [Synechococcus sp. CS-1325]MCT0212905.1 UDP-N-acetylmuramoyl-L-alanyl-D-glutamate--2,6-diaminopimelate ligase [Synechococcus sp. CS-1326]MCT0233109.1 UDP-N-acetylmuramoyl-L-alanyl-D-glutamate--2,6-diaminopimelate ligase [Synechococcus sp. CS-1327]PZU99625.1 MAG: UDP-N-acetylmuramoyl-L-alanyl-D-glutam
MPVLLHSLLQQIGAEIPVGLADGEVTGISCDSRRIGCGDLFIGLPGHNVDGGLFWPAAVAAGAVAAVITPEAAVARPPAGGDPVLVVGEPLADWAGQLAATFWREPSQRLGLIGVTGTNGKTTTTHLIEHLATCCGRPTALFGTLVNRWPGHHAPATHTTAFADVLQGQLAAAAEAGSELAAMEVSSHALDQGRVAGCRFAGAVFTNLSQDHLDYHPSMQAYFEAKARLFSTPLLEGAVVVNIDDPWGRQLADQLTGSLGERLWRSSLSAPSAELRMENLSFGAEGVSGTLCTPLGSGAFRSPLVGRFNLMNLLQAVGVLNQQGLALDPLLEAIPSFQGVPGRMERVALGETVGEALPAVLVDYAHTPDGLENALAACRPFCPGKLICVFGCGGDRDRGKRPQMAAIAARLADRVVVTSDNPRTEDAQRILDDVVAGIPAGTALVVEGDRARAIALAIAAAVAGDLVLIAGKGHEDYQILSTGRIHFDDREEAEQALALLRRRLRDSSADSN